MPSAEFKKKGTFADVVLPALLVHAVNARFTGMFRAERDSIIKVIYFKEGEIAFASSNQPSDRLGEVLIKRGQLTREQLDMAMSKLEANVSLGRMLVELGYLSPKELLSGAKTQVEEILYSLNSWREGGYEFTEGPLPPRIVDLKLNTRQVIFQCILQVEDRRWALEQIVSMETVFAPQHELAEALQQMRLEPEVQQVVSNIDGTNTVRDLASRSQLDEFTVTKVVAALFLLNLTRITAHEADEHGGEYLARFGEESETTAADSTVIGRPPGSETMPGFAPGFGGSSTAGSTGSYGSPFGGFEAPPEEPTAIRGSQPFGTPAPISDSLEDEPETSTRPGFGEEPLVAPSDDEEPGEDMAYEEEGLEEEAAGGRPKWLVPAIGALVVLALAGAGYAAYWFLNRPTPGGGESTPVAHLSPSATRASSPATPKATPAGSVMGMATPTPAGTALVGVPTALGTASSKVPGTPVAATPTAFAVASAIPTATRMAVATPVATIAQLSPTPMAHGTPSLTPMVHGTPSTAPTKAAATTTIAPAPTRAASAAPTPSKTPAVAVVATTPTLRPTPMPTKVAQVTPVPTAPPRTTPRVAPTPVSKTPVPVPTRTTGASPGGGKLVGPAVTLANEKLASGQFREAAQAFRQAASAASGYAIQLEIVCQDSSVREGSGHAGAAGDYFVLPFNFHGKPCYRAFWGVYPSRASAEQAQRDIPAFFRSQARGRPLPIVSLADVR